MKGAIARKSARRPVPVRIVHSGPEVAPSKYKAPKPKLYLDGKHAEAFMKKGKVGQKMTATIRGRVTELRTSTSEDGGGARHHAVIEIDHTSCGHGAED